MKNYIFITGLIVATFVAGCKKPDEVKPVISIESPKGNQPFPQGGSILFKATFSDDRELAQYKIDIHIDDDGHGHETLADEDWEEMIIGELSGTRQIVERQIPIPANAEPGIYHFIVKCIDKAGNEATSPDLDLYILGVE